MNTTYLKLLEAASKSKFNVYYPLWEYRGDNYSIILIKFLQEASLMYFVHSDCLPALELSINVKHEADRRLYAIAVVESKEYCYAKKVSSRRDFELWVNIQRFYTGFFCYHFVQYY